MQDQITYNVLIQELLSSLQNSTAAPVHSFVMVVDVPICWLLQAHALNEHFAD